MSKSKIWASIIGAGLVASITTAASFFPDFKVVLIASATFTSAIVSWYVGKK